MGRHWRKLKRHYLMHWQFVKVVKTELQFRSICPTNSDKRLHSHIVFRRRQVYPFLLFVHFVRLTYLNSSSLKCPKKSLHFFFIFSACNTISSEKSPVTFFSIAFFPIFYLLCDYNSIKSSDSFSRLFCFLS